MKYVIACRGDLNEAEMEIFGPFDTEEEAVSMVSKMETSCPNPHDVAELKHADG